MAKKRLPKEVREYLAALGSRGGKIGGKTAAANMTPEQRSERARKAVQAREAKRKGVASETAVAGAAEEKAG
jgi:hypothetical protein